MSDPGSARADAAIGPWPIDPDPASTNLPGPQVWHFAGGRALLAEAAGLAIPADDPRIGLLGVRRDAAGRPYPAAFARSPESGTPLKPAGPAPDPDVLEIEPGPAREIPLPGGRPILVRAGRPAAPHVFRETLGVLEAWDGAALAPLGRLPPLDGAGEGPPFAAGPAGLDYATRDALVAVPLPQLRPLDHGATGAPGLRFAAAPLREGPDLVTLGLRAGRVVLCRRSADGLTEADVGPAGPEDRFAGPWRDRAGDAVWTGPAGFVSRRAGAGRAGFTPWPEGFAPLLARAPWRDRADVPHQIGAVGEAYHYAALDGSGALHRLDGPHLAAGGTTYAGPERFDVPWQGPVETLNLGVHAGCLLVPLLAMARDTVLLALDIPGPRGDLLRGGRLARPVAGHVLHHAHGAGLRRLPATLEVAGLDDAGALLHDRVLYLWSRAENRCHALRLAPR